MRKDRIRVGSETGRAEAALDRLQAFQDPLERCRAGRCSRPMQWCPSSIDASSDAATELRAAIVLPELRPHRGRPTAPRSHPHGVGEGLLVQSGAGVAAAVQVLAGPGLAVGSCTLRAQAARQVRLQRSSTSAKPVSTVTASF